MAGLGLGYRPGARTVSWRPKAGGTQASTVPVPTGKVMAGTRASKRHRTARDSPPASCRPPRRSAATAGDHNLERSSDSAHHSAGRSWPESRRWLPRESRAPPSSWCLRWRSRPDHLRNVSSWGCTAPPGRSHTCSLAHLRPARGTGRSARPAHGPEGSFNAGYPPPPTRLSRKLTQWLLTPSSRPSTAGRAHHPAGARARRPRAGEPVAGGRGCAPGV